MGVIDNLVKGLVKYVCCRHSRPELHSIGEPHSDDNGPDRAYKQQYKTYYSVVVSCPRSVFVVITVSYFLSFGSL